MTFSAFRAEFPDYESIVGTPEEILQGARTWPDLPLETLWGRCLRCWHIQAMGRYVYMDERVELPDGSSTTATDWKLCAARAAFGKGWRVKAPCYECEFPTEHIAVKP